MLLFPVHIRFQSWCAGRACSVLYNSTVSHPNHCGSSCTMDLVKNLPMSRFKTGWKVHILRMTDEVIPVTCLVISHSGWHSQTSPVKSAPDFRANSLGSSVFFQPITQSDEQTWASFYHSCGTGYLELFTFKSLIVLGITAFLIKF